MNNAGTLGAAPLPALADYPPDALRDAFEVNVVAPLALTQLLLPALRAGGGAVLNITSDAAVEAYAGWGGYGAAKAALEQASNVLAAEELAIRVWWADPGDLRTEMHQPAFPGEDISDRPRPETSCPRSSADHASGCRAAGTAPPIGPGGARESSTSTCPPRWRHTNRPRPAAWPATGCACWSAARARAVSHHRFTDLPGLLLPGDLLVVNTSGTLPAAVRAGRRAGGALLHPLPDGAWLVELRQAAGKPALPNGSGIPGRSSTCPRGRR